MNPEHTTSVVYPIQPTSIAQVLPVTRVLQSRGSGRLWLGQSMGLETHQIFAALAGSGVRLPFGTSVALSPLRHPYDAAVQARSVAQLTGLPFVAGVGPGAREFQRMVSRDGYAKPVSAVRDYLTSMRELLAGRPVDADLDEHSVHAALPPMTTPPVELGLGVLRPAMARAAGQVADVAITWLTPPSYVDDILLPQIRAGAAEAGRAAPRVATVVHVAVARAGRDLRAIARSATSSHLSSGHYTTMLKQAGIPADPADPDTGAQLLLDSGTFVTGSPEQIADGLDGYRKSGVDEVILNLCGVLTVCGLGAAMTDLRSILAAVDGRRD